MSRDLINVVLDLETLSTAPDAAIIQIGAVVPQFDRKHILGLPFEFEATIRYEDCLEKVQEGSYLSQDNDTMQWWEKQPTRTQVFSGQLEYAEALEKFADWIKSFGKPVAIWGNGVGFDNVVLRHSLDAYGFHGVFDFRNDRCFRTVKNLFPLMEEATGAYDNEVKHTALGDARYEARMLDLIVQAYGIRSLV